MLWREVQTCSILHGVIFQKTLLLAGFRWTYFIHPEDGGDMFFRNVGWNSTGYTALYLTRWYRLPVLRICPCAYLSVRAIVRVRNCPCALFSGAHLWQCGFVCAELSCALLSSALLSGHPYKDIQRVHSLSDMPDWFSPLTGRVTKVSGMWADEKLSS
jgi:hypothetical protein